MRKVSLPMVAAMAAMTLRDIGAGNSTQAIPELTPYTKSRPKKKKRKNKMEIEEGAVKMMRAQEKRDRKNRKRLMSQRRCDSGYYRA